MKQGVVSKSNRSESLLLLTVAAMAGLCTMAYEVVWFRVLKYFVDNSIHSFAIMLITFLFGITVGGFLVSKFTDKRKDPFLLLAFLEIAIGLLSCLSIPLIAHMNETIQNLNKSFGNEWAAEIGIRFSVFSLALFLPTALMGGAFPLFTRMYSARSTTLGTSLGEVYASNTLGGVLGSFAGGFLLIPVFGVQGSIQALSCINIAIGLACLLWGSAAKPKFKMAAFGLAILVSIPFFLTPANAFVRIYSNRYPPPANKLLYCKENVNGTTTVFQDVQKTGQKYMLIDGTGEVSTDYFSMRAFRFLSILPALYSPQPKHALIVTFGTGIVAGAISNLPSIEHVDCIEICKEAFDASRNFSEQNHDVIHNPRINLIVNDGRNFVLTTKNKYDIISADATHPTSSDSWILYTKEFYTLCSTRLSDHGIMCQWIPLHGILENDYKVILATFHTAFPYVAVYYSGGYKTIGHTVLLGSKSPLKIDIKMANTLFADSLTRDDLAKVNVFNVYDFLNGFILDQEAINEFSGEVPLNTDDKPCIIFSKFKLLDTPFMGLTPIIKYRKNVYDQLCNIDVDSIAAVKQTVDRNFQAMGYIIGGQLLEFKEYNVRAAQNFDKSRDVVVRNLLESKAIFEQIIENYKKAMQLNPADYHTKFLFNRVSSEFEYLNSFLESMTQPR